MIKKIFYTIFILAIFIDFSIYLSFKITDFSEWIYYGVVGNKLHLSFDTVFYSYPLFLGLILTFYSPGFFGWKIGESLNQWKICLLYTLIIIVPVVTFLKSGQPTPFHNMGWQVYILAPIGEEAIFRGAVFSFILYFMENIYGNESRTPEKLAIIFSAISFGLWHTQNIQFYPLFTLFQIFYTTIIGLLLGNLRAKTGSIYPGIFIHFLINFFATFV